MRRKERHLADIDAGSPVGAPDDDSVNGGPRGATLVLVATLSTAFVAQGGFYGSAQWLIAGGLAVAGVLAFKRPLPRSAIGVGAMVAVSAVALAGWATVRGAVAGDLNAGLSRAGLLAGMAIVVVVCRSATSDDRDTLDLTGLAIGVGIAVTGWLGITSHVRPWAVSGSSTWRAASTMTYPNAAAAALVAVSLVAIARRTAQPRSPVLAVATMLCLTGALATQSRAGLVAFVVGGAVLFVVLDPRRVVAGAVAPATGAAIAGASLMPGLEVGDPVRPVIAVLGLGVGISVAFADAALAGRSGASRRVVAIVGGAIGAALVAAVVTGGAVAAIGDRVTIGSADRESTNRAALDVIAEHPVAGVGPGRLTVAWVTPDGVMGTRLVHNEYLQLVAELGIVGGALLAALLVAVARAVLSARRSLPAARWAGAGAAIAALLVHSAFDFLWHIPAIALLGAALFGLATSLDDPVPLTIQSQHKGESQHEHKT